ncbi:MAG: phospho-N-acetylmuramoyl-pentapeptide-transferase [Chloroflexi bacterium]|nr:phospho-N-acetylmuramoyl-pentapeptide-transferase [Chloroflexota bacterium]
MSRAFDLSALWLTPLSFAVAMAWGPWLIGRLRQLKFGKQIRADGPSSHMLKAGTPTMGGWLMVLTTTVMTIVFLRDWRIALPLLLAILGFAVFGSIDDLANLRSSEGLGLRVRYKFIWHTGIALVVALAMYLVTGAQSVAVPGVGTYEIGWWFVPLAVLTIFSTTSGVNEADGLDGLAGGTVVFAFAAYLAIALAGGQTQSAAFCAIVVGTVLAFLWFNVNPASVFMGDAGSLALGAGLATVALISGWVLLLPIVGLVFVVELLSVMLQVAYFKATKGKRIFKMSPLHHHFELSGWPEVNIVQRFWLVAAVAAVIGVLLAI